MVFLMCVPELCLVVRDIFLTALVRTLCLDIPSLSPKVPKSTYQPPMESELLARQRETQQLRAEVQGVVWATATMVSLVPMCESPVFLSGDVKGS